MICNEVASVLSYRLISQLLRTFAILALGLASLARGVFLLNNVKASITDIEIKFR